LDRCKRTSLSSQSAASGDVFAVRAGVALPARACASSIPNAPREWSWQWGCFPGQRAIPSISPLQERRRHHLQLDRFWQRAVRYARVMLPGVDKRVSWRTFRHSFATHLLESGYTFARFRSSSGMGTPRTTMILYPRSSSRAPSALRARSMPSPGGMTASTARPHALTFRATSNEYTRWSDHSARCA